MPLLAVTDVHLSHEDRHLLRGVSLSIEQEDRIGLLGINGSGKSSLLSILAGVQTPDSGERTVRRDLRIGYLEQEPRLRDSTTVREEILSGLVGRATVLEAIEKLHLNLADPKLTDSRMEQLLKRQESLEAELEALGGHDVEHKLDAMIQDVGLLDGNARCGTLSGGERRRVALARLLLSKPDLLLLDEPTNHLDAVVTDWLEDRLLDSIAPMVMVTHDRYVLDRVASRIVELDRGSLTSYEGNYTDYLTARAEKDLVESHLSQVRRNTLRRETAWIRRGPPAQRKKSKARLAQYWNLVDSEPEAAGADLEFLLPPGPRLGTRVLNLSEVTQSFGTRCVFPPLTLEIGPAERIGIIGPNGAGKSTLLRILTGELEPTGGKVVVGETVRFAVVDQHRTELDPEKTVLQEIAGKNDFVAVGDRMLRIESFLEQFLFPGDRKHQPISKLSGGERHRVVLAKLLCKSGNVLVLDEPTNDLDIASLRALEEALMAFPGTVLVVSHDRWFLDRVATRIIHFDGRGHCGVHEGALSLLLARWQSNRSSTGAQDAQRKERTKVAETAASQKIAERKLSFSEKKELDGLPDKIAAAEKEVADLDRQLADPALYAKPRNESERLAATRRAAEERVAGLYARWETLENLRGASLS